MAGGHDASRTFIIVATYANETVRENWTALVILELENWPWERWKAILQCC